MGKILGCVLAMVISIACGLAVAWMAMLCWNIVVPALFHGPSIDFTTALALIALLSIVAGMFKTYNSKA